MSDIAALNIDPKTVSQRLFFGKQSIYAAEWHVFDAALRLESGETLALHDEPIFLNGKIVGVKSTPMFPIIIADSLQQLNRMRGELDQFCELCFIEFTMAADILKKERLLKFK